MTEKERNKLSSKFIESLDKEQLEMYRDLIKYNQEILEGK